MEKMEAGDKNYLYHHSPVVNYVWEKEQEYEVAKQCRNRSIDHGDVLTDIADLDNR